MAGPKREREKLRGGGGNSGKPKTPKGARETRDVTELREYAAARGTTISDNVANHIRFNDLRETVGVIEELAGHFGVAQGDLVRDIRTGPNGVMAASRGMPTMFFNPTFYREGAMDISSLMNSPGSTFHPANQTQGSTAAHETAHLLVQRLYDKYSGLDRALAISDRTEAKDVVKAALKQMNDERKAAGQEKVLTGAAVASVSGYARKNRDETVAEAFADVYANRKSAAPFSQAIWREMEKRFNVQTSYLG